MQSTYKEERNRELNTAMQTVRQRVLGCKLGIISNWVFQPALVKICHFGGFSPPPPALRLHPEALQNVSALTVSANMSVIRAWKRESSHL